MESIKKILILVDETPSSENVVKCGYGIARQLSAEVALLHVENSQEYRMDMATQTIPRSRDKRFLHSRQYLENLYLKFADGLTTKMFVVDGRIKESVLSTAEEWHAQLIIVGTHEHKGLGSLFKENINEDIIHSSTVPILIVPVDKMVSSL